MWLITQGSTDYQYATTKEKETISSPYYIVRFIQDTGKNERYCTVTDSSSYPLRFQKFSITETTTPTAFTSQVKLDHKASWKYYIYEISAADYGNIISLDLVDYTALNEVEQGRVKVYPSSTTTLATYTGYQSTFEENQ